MSIFNNKNLSQSSANKNFHIFQLMNETWDLLFNFTRGISHIVESTFHF